VEEGDTSSIVSAHPRSSHHPSRDRLDPASRLARELTRATRRILVVAAASSHVSPEPGTRRKRAVLCCPRLLVRPEEAEVTITPSSNPDFRGFSCAAGDRGRRETNVRG